jgi:lysophospholipase L1-like esterase
MNSLSAPNQNSLAMPKIIRSVLRVLSAFVFLWVATCSPAQIHPAAVPTDRLSENWWAERHTRVLEEIKAHPDVQLLMIGDSITNNYEKSKLPDENFQPTWQKFYEPRRALNLGFSGDTTANVLWRLEQGEVEGLHPKVAVLLIGTVNTGHANQSAEETEVGVDAVIADLERRLPETHVLLLGILPSDLSPGKTESDRTINQYLAVAYAANPRVTYLDIGSIFYKNGSLNEAIFYDPRLPGHPGPLHPDTIGQRLMAEGIEPTLSKLMGDAPHMPLESMTDINTALIPVERIESDAYDWYARHNVLMDLKQRSRPRVVLIGDSITQFWGGEPDFARVYGPNAWQRVFGNMPVINMGFGWDRAQNVLWRLRQGEFDGLHPQWVVLNIGSNNLTGSSNARANTPEEVVEAIATICGEIRRRSPESHLILMGIFPRGAKPDEGIRPSITKTNQLLAQRFGKDPSVTYLDIGQQFLAPDGSLRPELMPDSVHPSDAGYLIWADALIKTGLKP